MEQENPVDLFDLRVAHVGINTDSPEEASRVANLICALLGIERARSPFRSRRFPAPSLRS